MLRKSRLFFRCVVCLALIFQCLATSGCTQPEPIGEYRGRVEFGPGAPSWLVQADYDDYAETVEKWAKDLGLTESAPSMVRWIRPDEWASVMGKCWSDNGLTVTINESRSEINVADLPAGQENLEDYARWVCFAKYPQMPDSEHGKFSEKTKRIMYEWASKDLVACLEAEGFQHPDDIVSYEVFWDNYDNDNWWSPYSSWDVGPYFDSKGIDIEAKCPQWPKDGRLDYQYHEVDE